MNSAAIGLVALDIDGTLLDIGTRVPRVTAKAASLARACGHHIVLATGRSLVGSLPVAKSMGASVRWIVASNGAITARVNPNAPGGYDIESMRVFDADPVIVAARGFLPGVRIAVEEVGWGWRVNAPFEDGRLNGQQRVVGDTDELWAAPVSRLALAAPGITRHAERLRQLGVTVNRDGLGWLDITARGLSKASALEAIRLNLGVPHEHTVAVGDGWNDLEMFEWARRSVAMGQALPAIKNKANEVTGTVQEHGAATVLQSLVSHASQRNTVLA